VSTITQKNELLREQLLQTLDAIGYAALRNIDCRVEKGIVRLIGDVPSFYVKQVAQSAVQNLAGVQEIRNELQVRPNP
jgi:osmotically-inducible protein OsmY